MKTEAEYGYIRVIMLAQPDVKEKLDEMTKQDHRSMSNFLNMLIIDEYERRNLKLEDAK